MQDVVVDDSRGAFGRTYAEPLSGLRVSWGAVLAGAVAMLAVTLLLAAFALAVISLITRPEAGSLKVSVVALWICAMVATLVGAFVGGMVAGYLPGSPRGAIAIGHGFLAWAVALVVSFAVQLGLMRGIVMTTGGLVVDTLASDSASSQEYGGDGDAMPRDYGTVPPGGRGRQASPGRIALNYVIGAGWSWFGTWFGAGLLAVAGAAIGRRRVGYADLVDRRVDRDQPMGPLTPAPTV